ncbi:MAG: ATP-binding protein [Turneriella sp.]
MSLREDFSYVQINHELEFVVDDRADLTINQISRLPAAAWTRVAKTGFGQTRGRFWFKLDLRSETKESLKLVLEIAYAVLDRVAMYEPSNGGEFKERILGTLFPRRETYFLNFSPAFSLELSGNSGKIIYFSVESSRSSIYMPTRLFSAEAFHTKTVRESMLLGIFFGLMVIIFFYALFLWISTHSAEYGYFLAFVFFFALTALIMTGVGAHYFWSSGGWFNRTGLFCLHMLDYSAIWMFALKYLNVAEKYRILARMVYIFVGYNLLIMIAVVFGGESVFPGIIFIQNFSVSLQIIVLVSVCLILSLRKSRPALLFLFGWAIFFSGLIGRTLMMQGVLPSIAFFEWSFLSGPAVGISILSVALSDRLNLLQRDRNRIQQEAIENKQKAIDSLMEASRIKDEFLAKTSHELRTPVHAVIGLAENLLAKYSAFSDAQVPETLATIAKTGKRLNALINDVLDYSKLRRSTPVLHIRAVDIRQVIENSRQLLEPLAKTNGLVIEINVAQSVPPLRADPDRLEQILNNLISNAIKYTRSGKITLSVTFSGKARISVSDTGVGIRAADLLRIFEPFEQADSGYTRNYGGTGLGLYITRQLVSAHGATIEVHSTEGVGSDFFFFLEAAVGVNEVPAMREVKVQLDSMNPATEPLHYREQPQKQPLLGMKILVVDDDHLALRVTADFLRDSGFSVTCAGSGAEALNFLEHRESFDLAIIDLMMPNISGFDLCHALRRNEHSADVPILVLSAMLQTKYIMQALESGATDYLLKPFERPELLFRIHTLLEYHRARQTELSAPERKKEIVEETHRRIFANMHDHVGSHLLDLKLKIHELLRYGKAEPTQMEDLVRDVERLINAFRNGIDHVDDLLKISRDFAMGLHIIALRRYSRAGRQLLFDRGNFPDEMRVSEPQLFEILSIITEVITNDLKYGLGASSWRLSLSAGGECEIAMTSKTRFDPVEHTGHGMAGIFGRAKKIFAEALSLSENEEYQFKLRLRLQSGPVRA